MKGLEMKYFVLKPRGNDDYAKASRSAMRDYARKIYETDSSLSLELEEWAEMERLRAREGVEEEA